MLLKITFKLTKRLHIFDIEWKSESAYIQKPLIGDSDKYSVHYLIKKIIIFSPYEIGLNHSVCIITYIFMVTRSSTENNINFDT